MAAESIGRHRTRRETVWASAREPSIKVFAFVSRPGHREPTVHSPTHTDISARMFCMAARVVSVSAAVVKSRPQTLAMGRKEPATARPRALRATPARPSTGTWDNAGCGKVIGDAPKNTSADIIARLNTVVNAAEPRIKTRLAGLGAAWLGR